MLSSIIYIILVLIKFSLSFKECCDFVLENDNVDDLYSCLNVSQPMKPKDIAVISYATTNIKNYAAYSFAINSHYLLTPSSSSTFSPYSFHIYSEFTGHNYEPRDQRWNRVKILIDSLDQTKGLMKDVEYIMWIDADLIFIDNDQEGEKNSNHYIQEIIEDYDYADIIISAEKHAETGVANTGCFIVKNTLWSREFLSDWWNNYDHSLDHDQIFFDKLYKHRLDSVKNSNINGNHDLKSHIVILPTHVLNSIPPPQLYQEEQHKVLHLMGESGLLRQRIFKKAYKNLCSSIYSDSSTDGGSRGRSRSSSDKLEKQLGLTRDVLARESVLFQHEHMSKVLQKARVVAKTDAILLDNYNGNDNDYIVKKKLKKKRKSVNNNDRNGGQGDNSNSDSDSDSDSDSGSGSGSGNGSGDRRDGNNAQPNLLHELLGEARESALLIQKYFSGINGIRHSHSHSHSHHDSIVDVCEDAMQAIVECFHLAKKAVLLHGLRLGETKDEYERFTALSHILETHAATDYHKGPGQGTAQMLLNYFSAVSVFGNDVLAAFISGEEKKRILAITPLNNNNITDTCDTLVLSDEEVDSLLCDIEAALDSLAQLVGHDLYSKTRVMEMKASWQSSKGHVNELRGNMFEAAHYYRLGASIYRFPSEEYAAELNMYQGISQMQSLGRLLCASGPVNLYTNIQIPLSVWEEGELVLEKVIKIQENLLYAEEQMKQDHLELAYSLLLLTQCYSRMGFHSSTATTTSATSATSTTKTIISAESRRMKTQEVLDRARLILDNHPDRIAAERLKRDPILQVNLVDLQKRILDAGAESDTGAGAGAGVDSDSDTAEKSSATEPNIDSVNYGRTTMNNKSGSKGKKGKKRKKRKEVPPEL